MMEEVDELLEQRQNPSTQQERLIDEYFDALGLSSVDAEWLTEALEDSGIRRDEEMTFIVPRQLPTDTVEQIGMTIIGENIGEELTGAGEIDSFEVVGAPLSDKMYGRNAEKRGYALPAVVSPRGVQGANLADIKDGYSIGSHTVDVNGNAETVEDMLGMDSGTENLRKIHGSREDGIVESRGNFTSMQQRMLSEMFAAGQRPEIIGLEYEDGKMVGLQYDSRTDTYQSLDEERPVSMTPEEMSDSAVLLPEDSYEKLVFPMAAHPDIGYMLKGLENDKFRTEATEEFVETFEDEGLKFPFIDASSTGKYSEEVPDAKIEEINSTPYGATSSPSNEAKVLNAYPEVSVRSRLDPQEVGENSFEETMRNVVREVY